MASLDYLFQERKRYENLLNDVQSLISTLGNSKNSIEPVKSNLVNNYSFDLMSADNEIVSKNITKINDYYNYIKSNVIQEINNKIYGLNSDITQEKERIRRVEEEERKKLEEEKLKAKKSDGDSNEY